MNSTNLLQNRQNAASGCSGTLKMEAFGTQNGTSGQQNERPELPIEAQEPPDGVLRASKWVPSWALAAQLAAPDAPDRGF